MRPTGAVLATRDRRLRRRDEARKRQLRDALRVPARTSSRPRRPTRWRRRDSAGRGSRARRPMADRAEPRDRPRRAPSSRPTASRPRPSARAARRARPRPGRVRRAPATRACAPSPTPSTSTGQHGIAPGHRARPRRPPAAPAAVGLARFRARHPPRPADAPRCPRRPPPPRAAPRSCTGSRSGSSSARSTTSRSAPGSSCAAPPAGRASGSRSTRLAHAVARGILAEPYRWAELEQLVYSPSRWERRLVGSTIATLTHGSRGQAPRPDDRRPARCRSSASSWATPSRTSRRRSSWALSLPRGVDRAAVTAVLRAAGATAPRHRRRPPRLGHPRHARQARSGRRRRAAQQPRRASAAGADAASDLAPPPPWPPRSGRCPTRHAIPDPRCDRPTEEYHRDRRHRRRPSHPHRGRDARLVPRLRDERHRRRARCPTCATASSPSIAGSCTRWARWGCPPPARTASAPRSSAR